MHFALHVVIALEYSSLSWAECILIEVPNGYFKGGVLCSEYITCIPIPYFLCQFIPSCFFSFAAVTEAAFESSPTAADLQP